MKDKSIMSNIRSLGHFRLALLATILLLVTVLAVGSLFAANDRANPEIQPAAESAHFDGVDPGLDAKPPVAERVEPPDVVVESQPGDGTDPGAGQEVEGSGGTSTLSQWLSDRPDEMGPFSTSDVLAADDLDVAWLLYQAVDTGMMTEDEADAFRAWFSERPTAEEAPELLQYQPGTVYVPGDQGGSTGTKFDLLSK